MLWFENNEIAIFFSLKADGDMLFKQTQMDTDEKRIDADEIDQKVRDNRISFFKKHDIDPKRLVNLAGVHGTHIAMTCHNDLGRGALDAENRIPNTDGLISNIRNSYLMITGADCFPVFFYDPKKQTIGVAHCGWRGIIKGLPAKIIDRFRNEFGSSPTDVQIWIGPGIKSCHFEIKNNVVKLLQNNHPAEILERVIVERDEKYFTDLPKAIVIQLTKSGIKPQNITEHPDCTFCEKHKYFSYRRDKSEVIEANAFIIHLK